MLVVMLLAIIGALVFCFVQGKKLHKEIKQAAHEESEV
jgi:hypothetical protein